LVERLWYHKGWLEMAIAASYCAAADRTMGNSADQARDNLFCDMRDWHARPVEESTSRWAEGGARASGERQEPVLEPLTRRLRRWLTAR